MGQQNGHLDQPESELARIIVSNWMVDRLMGPKPSAKFAVWRASAQLAIRVREPYHWANLSFYVF